MTKTRNEFHFPEGFGPFHLDTSYCDAQFNMGEKVIIEDEEQVFIVVDIQNQFRAMGKTEGGNPLKMIMRNVVLGKFPSDGQGKLIARGIEINVKDITEIGFDVPPAKGRGGIVSKAKISSLRGVRVG